MISTAANSAAAAGDKNPVNLKAPPPPACLQPKSINAPGFVNASTFDRIFEQRLTVEFPTQEQGKATNIGLCFKRFMTILFATDKSIELLNWSNPDENPISDINNLQGTEEITSQYFSGMQVLTKKRKITGFIKIKNKTPLWKTKRNKRFFQYVDENKVYVRQTTLSENHHANIGWFLFSHPDFTNQANAVKELKQKIQSSDLEFELVPHRISHIDKDNQKISTRALKVRCNFSDQAQVKRERMDASCQDPTYDPLLSTFSSTGNFKLVPFEQDFASVNGLTKIVKAQNDYLHNITAISVVNIAHLDGTFLQSKAIRMEEDSGKIDAD